MMKLQILLKALLPLAVVACGDSVGPGDPSTSATVAITQSTGGHPSLLYGTAIGTQRTQLHFTNVADSIAGNLTDLVVSDSTLLALGSPALFNNRIAVVATVAFDQSEIVVMDAITGKSQVASMNGQIIGSVPAWSSDGQHLAYTMSTLPGFGGLDLFTTDLHTHTVARLTNVGNLHGAAVAWAGDDKSIYYARTTGDDPDSENSLSEVVQVDVATKASHTVASNIVGVITSIDPLGNMLVLRKASSGSSTQLISRKSNGAETVVASDATSGRFLNDAIFVLVGTGSGFDIRRADIQSPSTPIQGVSSGAAMDAFLQFRLD